MLTISLTVINKLGLHARAAMKLSDLAARFQSEIIVIHNDRKRDVKDIMAVMSLGAKKGMQLNFHFDGEDEQDAQAAIEKLFLNRFGEDE